jgi:hypothetical protein
MSNGLQGARCLLALALDASSPSGQGPAIFGASMSGFFGQFVVIYENSKKLINASLFSM